MKRSETPQERINDTGKEVDELSFVYRGIECGKHCHRCPHFYWYAHWREGAKVKVKYIGKSLPSDAQMSYTRKHHAKHA